MQHRAIRMIAIAAGFAGAAAMTAGCAATTTVPGSPSASGHPMRNPGVQVRDSADSVQGTPAPVKHAPSQAAPTSSRSAGSGSGPTVAPSGHAVLGPNGYRVAGYPQLRLGMSKAQAEATGMLTDARTSGVCTWYHIRSSAGGPGPVGDQGVVISPTLGVVSIPGPGTSRTPEGITSGQVTPGGPYGSTLAQVKRAYPDAFVEKNGFVYRAPAPGDEAAHYVFAIQQNRVNELGLTSDNTGECHLGS